jgi:hypothetical protein
MMVHRSRGMTRNNSHTLGNTRSEATKEWLDRGTTIRRIRGSEALVGPVWASLYYTKGREWKHFPFPKSWCTISSTYASTTLEVRSCSARSLTLLAPTTMLSKAAAAPLPARSCTAAGAAAAVTAAAKRSVVVCVCGSAAYCGDEWSPSSLVALLVLLFLYMKIPRARRSSIAHIV